MAQCPKCKAPVQDTDFGLVICARCGASFLLDINGDVSIQATTPDDSDMPESQEPSDSQSVSGESGLSQDWFDEAEASTSIGTSAKTTVLNLPEDQNLENVPMDEWGGQDENSKVVTLGKETKDYRNALEQSPDRRDATSVVNHPYDGDYKTENPGVTPKAEANLDDIRNFGNALTNQDGPLLYSIRIRGIDSQELRQDLRGILSDRRFLFDVEALLKDVHSGEMVLPGISAVKAQVLVSNLLSLPLQIEWEQNANGHP